MDFDFLAVDKMENMGAVVADGVVGLSPARKEGNTVLLEELKKNGIIDKKVFALKLGGGPPSIIFGRYDHLLKVYGSP